MLGRHCSSVGLLLVVGSIHGMYIYIYYCLLDMCISMYVYWRYLLYRYASIRYIYHYLSDEYIISMRYVFIRYTVYIIYSYIAQNHMEINA